MRIPKRYGESKVDRCPFCDEQATAVNKQGVPVCRNHTKKELGIMRCVCGEILDIKQGKYGVFFTCMNCGTMNMRKALEINQPARTDMPYKVKDRSSSKKPDSSASAEKKRDDGARESAVAGGAGTGMCEGSSESKTSGKKGGPEKYRCPVFIKEDEFIRSDDPRYFD